MLFLTPSPLRGEGWGEGRVLAIELVVPHRHPGAGRKRFTTAEGWSSSFGSGQSSPRTFPPACRLRGGRFDRLPTLESLFFCWPKRKVTQRKWPERLVASCLIQALGLKLIGTYRSIRHAVRLNRNAPLRRGLKAVLPKCFTSPSPQRGVGVKAQAARATTHPPPAAIAATPRAIAVPPGRACAAQRDSIRRNRDRGRGRRR